ncbi:hypothetical protein BW733_08480 [Tessaracoccus flavescens]|uniref:Uncharacterized protein n=1 Tax=Tessaracoccus flavescens TaxID=399497 RepID=A0A1Q2CXQ4_9ACTN|nr:hypothetical protein BW733_08480 [Tessaracoccus flavescens]
MPAEEMPAEAQAKGGGSDKSVPVVERVPIEPVAIEVTGEPGEWLQADETPISVKGVEAAEINVLDDGAVPDSQVALAFEVTSETAETDIEVDLEALEDAGLLADIDRARLVELPACYATTPDAPQCSKPVAVLDAAPTAEKTLSVSGLSGASTLMAVAAAESGENGSYAAQPLAPSSTWSTGGSTGEFSWSYPLAVPDLALQGAIAPTVGLSYNSSTVDGRVRTTNNQAGLIGQGWGYEAGFIERRYVTCDSHPEHPKPGEGDLCWAGEALFLNFGDRSAEIVRDDATGVFKLKKDDGTRIEKLTGAPNGVLNGEHWKLTTPDGMQYFFGREALPGRTDQALTQSTWSVPVYGAAAGDPCYNSADFESSKCVQGWRWNLDYAEDTYGNAMAYYYNKEMNYYEGSSRMQYTRGGIPLRIDYGLRNENNSIYGSPVGARVVFEHAERCMPTADFACDPSLFTTNNKGRWPDTPRDLKCEVTGTCMVGSPTFWNQRRITKIYTQILTSGGTWLTRDSYALGHSFPSAVDTSLWLSSITHTSYSTTGEAITRDPIEFTHIMNENRVVGDTMPMMRLREIRDEVGLQTQVTYTPQDCSPTSLPTGDLSANTRRCFPVKWTTPGASEPSIDFFHKYLVSNIDIFDLAGNSPAQRYRYNYGGTPAWRYDDNELTKAKDRSWGQFRGYQYVDTLFGDPANTTNGTADKLNVTRTYYLRGLHSGKTESGTASVTRQNSLGENIVDFDLLAGAAYETQTFLSHTDLANPLAKSLTTYEIKPATATRARTGISALTSNVIGVTTQRTITPITTGGNLTSTITSTLDALGRPTAVSTTGSNADSSCVRTSYAQNTARNILALPAEVTTTAGTCAETGTQLRGARIFYDGSTTLGQVTGPGSATRTETAVSATEWARAVASYDAAGRIISSTAYTSASDTTGRVSKTNYSPTSGGPIETVTTTNPLGQSASTAYNIDGQSIKETGVSGQSTEATYDALGRITAVWEPGFPKTGPATRTYSYTISRTAPETTTTKTTTQISGTTATQTTTIAIYDAFGQQIQTQADAVGGGRIVDNAFYNSNGQVAKTWNHWYTTGAPSGTPVLTTESAIDSRTQNYYDGAGRITDAVSYKGTTETRRTKTLYTGNQTLVVPPGGFGINSIVVNALGQTLEKRDYVTAPTISGATFSGGTYKTTKFTTDAVGQQTGLTDPTGAVWAYTYDLAGNRTKAVDPDTGTSTTTYNHLGQKLTSVDARGSAGTLKFTYDALGRTTKVVGGVGDKTIATWTYDTLRPGLLTESRSYANGDTANAYVQKVNGYDTYARPTGMSTIIPASQGTLAGTYSKTTTYNSVGQTATEALPALGGLPAETLTRTYTSQGQPYSVVGAKQYVTKTSYNALGLVSNRVGHEGDSLSKAYVYNSETLAIDSTAFNANSNRPQVQFNAYTRNSAGLITKASTSMNYSNPAGVRTMCYRYDTRMRLTEGWTSTDSCKANPTSTNKTTGGVLPIWHQWTYNDAGVRTKLVRNKVVELPAATTTTTSTLATTGPKHAVASDVSVTGSTTTTSNYTYDAAGNTTKTVTGSVTENLTWDAQGKLVTVANGTKTTSYIRDADGNILVRKDPAGTTIYTPAGELRLTGTSTKTGTRFYSHAGETVAQRIGATVLQALDSDHLGTGTVAVNWADLNQTAWRMLDPFGNHIATIGAWQTDHTYLDKATDASTGYVQMGARVYNPKNGRFLSVDPIMSPYVANTLNGYSYTAGDPINSSDPTGLNPRLYHQNPDSPWLVTSVTTNPVTLPTRETTTRTSTRYVAKESTGYYRKGSTRTEHRYTSKSSSGGGKDKPTAAPTPTATPTPVPLVVPSVNSPDLPTVLGSPVQTASAGALFVLALYYSKSAETLLVFSGGIPTVTSVASSEAAGYLASQALAAMPDLSFNPTQYRKHAKKHIKNYTDGVRVRSHHNPVDQQWYRDRIDDVYTDPDEIRVGTIRGQNDPVIMMRKGDDLLWVKTSGEYISMFPTKYNGHWAKAVSFYVR